MVCGELLKPLNDCTFCGVDLIYTGVLCSRSTFPSLLHIFQVCNLCTKKMTSSLLSQVNLWQVSTFLLSQTIAKSSAVHHLQHIFDVIFFLTTFSNCLEEIMKIILNNQRFLTLFWIKLFLSKLITKEKQNS